MKLIQRRRLWIIGIIFIVILAIQWWRMAYQNRLPNFYFKTAENVALQRKDLSDYFTRILIINHLNSFTKSIIKEISQIHNEVSDRLIIFYNGNFDKIQIENKSGIFSIKKYNKETLSDKFNLKEPKKNWILLYEKGSLKQKIMVKSRNKKNIIQLHNIDTPSKGDIENICFEFKKRMSNNKPGVYYFSQRLVASCACYRTFEFLETELINIGSKLRLLLDGKFSDLDIENFQKEKNYRVIIERAKSDIISLVHDWNISTKRKDFNLIVIKTEKQFYIFPLIDNVDYQKWLRFKESRFNDIIEELRN